MLLHRTQYPDPVSLSSDLRALGARGAELAGVVGEGVQYAELFYRICMNKGCAISGS